ncbi:MAG: hypothetical protein SPL75_02955 [Bacilli bacterium]|nr:hypothetical protein [Bacilli bacterium]MDY6362713.1 hypothetical protein [Bacilli bacterium]
MKKKYLALLLIPLLLAGCSTPTASKYAEKSGEIGAFKLTGPENDTRTHGGFTFTWEEATNASSYSIEISAREDFYNDPNQIYVKEDNISQPRYDLSFSLPRKDIIYYWRVTAVNKDHFKMSNTRRFFYESVKSPEIPIVIDEVDDWTVHKEGSQAELSIDRSNFFGNNEPSLVISFDMEHTKQGIPTSDGWMVITKSEDRELYGTDSFLFDFYYSGHDATILMRVLDDDGEYWHNEVKVSRNSKQTVVMKYEDFSLRTAGTNIFNRKFDWQRIHYFEIVFERTFGDGVCLVSNIRAVSYDDYKWMFMDKMDFRGYDEDLWTNENYKFGRTISEDGSELTLSYGGDYGNFPGYGFQNIPVNKILATGDAIRMKVKYTGASAGSTFYFRVTEQDVDRWQFKTEITSFTKDEYNDLVIPLKALRRPDSGSMNGDGAKQFFFILRFNMGLANNYQGGTLSIKDLEMVTIKKDIQEDNVRKVTSDGLIENFNNYDIYTQMYYYWEQSSENVDEAMKLDTIHKTGGNKNAYCGEFDYKADMQMATYQLYLNTDECVDKNAFKVSFKDASVKASNAAVAYLDPEKVAADLTIQLTLDTGEWYRYHVECLKKEWHVYTICFSDFTLDPGSQHIGEPQPLTSNHIVHIGFGFQYFYYLSDGKTPYPTYAIANPVYLDDIYLTEASETSIVEVDETIKPDPLNPDRVLIDDFESLTTPESVFEYWTYNTTHPANSMTPSDEVHAGGGNKSLSMAYQGSTSVSYGRVTPFHSSVLAKGLSIDIKSDGKATIYINLNWRDGGTLMKMRRVISPSEYSNSDGWYHYEFGFNQFTDTSYPGKAIRQTTAVNIETISFGLTGSMSAASKVYIDNICLWNTYAYSRNVISAIV